jgi:glycerophosphoryl diester phosphodiesterase
LGFTVQLVCNMRGSVVLFLLCFYGCTKSKPYENVRIYGHAATGLENVASVYHDNTIEGVNLALSMQGCDGIEVDVHLSADGDLWLYHDAQLESETNLTGCIPDALNEVLQTGKYASVHKEKLARLSEIDTNHLKGKDIVLDLRHYNECLGEYVNVVQIIDQLVDIGYSAAKDFRVLVNVSRKEWVQPFVEAGFHTVLSIYSMAEFTYAESVYPEIYGYIMKNSEVTAENVKAIHQSGKKLFIFEVRSTKMTRDALRKGPDGILSDDLRTAIIEKY